MAVAADANALCISNGNHFGRFVPYPAEIARKLCCVYPEEMSYRPEDLDKLMEKYRYGSNLDMSGVPLDDVKATVDEILKRELKSV